MVINVLYDNINRVHLVTRSLYAVWFNAFETNQVIKFIKYQLYFDPIYVLNCPGFFVNECLCYAHFIVRFTIIQRVIVGKVGGDVSLSVRNFLT